MLNKAATPVRQIQPENSYQDNRNTSNNRSNQNDRYEDRYQSDRRDDRRNNTDYDYDRQRIIVIIGITMTESIHLIGKIVTGNRTREVIIKKIGNPIIFGGKMMIAKEIDDSIITRNRKGIDHFNMNLEKGIRRILRILAGNTVKPVVL